MITLHVRHAKSLMSQTIGLIGAKQAYALLLRTRFGIHTFGLRFPIDVVILDTTYHIVALKKNLKPNRIFVWSPIWSLVIELPAGSIAKKRLHIGDHVKLISLN